ncbi:MAG: SAM-dependent methyltransferase [Dermatophilaceae bacterium]
MIPWATAWQHALYAEGGFYRDASGPAGHFTTSCHGALGVVFASAIGRLAEREGLATIVDVGSGRGELLGFLAASPVAADVRLLGVDVVAPQGLPHPVAWRRSDGGSDIPDLHDLGPALVIANEWLDVVPCVVAEADASGRVREVLVDGAGRESLGSAVSAGDRAWASRWWPARRGVDRWVRGERIEIGRSRDEAYAGLLAACAPGSLVVAIDYGHLRADRPAGGTLTGYRAGHQVSPVPDATCDLTAHVAMDALGADRLITQRDALGELGLVGERASYEQARSDPRGYLAALERNSAISALRGPGLGDFWWAISRVP